MFMRKKKINFFGQFFGFGEFWVEKRFFHHSKLIENQIFVSSPGLNNFVTEIK